MNDFKIKDSCERCGGNEDLDGVIHSFLGEDKKLYMESATLCSPCRIEFEKAVEHMNDIPPEMMDIPKGYPL